MPRRLRKPAQTRRAAVVVALQGLFDGDDDGPKWVQVTREGNFPGYLGGLKPFAFTRADLDAMVANIRNHPAYATNDQGQPVGRVIPWDFNHASEADPTSGDLPVMGAPSQGWTLDLEVRNGADGKAELWALTQFLEPARTYVKTGQYQWASVAVAFNATHPETAENIGALVTSIALTNTPFVEGMEKLVANRQGGAGGDEQVQARRTWFEAARDAGEAISMMRELFALPETAGVEEIMAHVGIVRSWLESGAAPLGTDPEHIIGSMRIILNLPALTPQLAVLDEAGQSIQALLQEQAAAAGVPATPSPEGNGMVPEPSAVAASRQMEEEAMDELIKVLASLLGVRENEESIKSAVRELAELRDGLTNTLGLSRDGATVILAAAKEGVDAKAKLLSLFEALGVQDPDAALQKVASTMEQAAKLTEVMPELEGLRADKEKADEASAEADVDAAIAARRLDKGLKPALLLQRKNDPEGFAKSFPKIEAPTSKQHLLSPVATRGNTPQRVTVSRDGATVQLGGPEGGSPNAPAGGDVIDLNDYEGANPTARAKAYLKAHVTNWDKLSNEEQFLQAVALKRKPNVINGGAATA